MSRGLVIKSTLIAVAFCFSVVAHAMAEPPRPIRIAPGPLVPALESLSKQMTLELIYEPKQLKSFRTAGVSGTYSARDAVRLLLRGTPLEVEVDRSGAMAIVPPGSAGAGAREPSGAKGGDSPVTSQNPGKEGKSGSSGEFRLAQMDRGANAGSSPAPSGAAQAASDPPTPAAQKSGAGEQLEQIVITATGTNIAGIAPVGTESLTLGRAAILSTGLTDINSVLQTLPQVVNEAPAGVANYREGGTSGYGGPYGGGNPSQGTAINLRGLGPQATLVLVDGHRVTPTGAAGVFTDTDQIPVAALESIQIIDDGNSAIYGSDAVAGVVNYVIRKDMNGIEVSPRATWNHGYDEQGISLIGGHTWGSLGALGKGNFMVTFDYDHRSAMPDSSSPYLLDDLSALGGVNNEVRGSSITTGAVNGGVGPGQPGQAPNTSGGTGPVASPGAAGNVAWCDNYNPFGQCATYLYRALPGGAGVPAYAQTLAQPSLADRAPEADFLGRLRRYQLAAFYNQDITDGLGVSFEGFWTRRDLLTAGSQYNSDSPPVVTVNPGSPYYITPPAPAGGPMTIDLSPAALGLPLWYTDNPDTNWTVIAGLHAALWGDWRADLSATVGRDVTCGECQVDDQIDPGALQYYVNGGQIDPLGNAPLTPAQRALFVGTNVQWSKMGMEDYVLKLNGTLLQLPAGPLKAAIGGEFMHNTENIYNGASRTDVPSQGIEESAALPPVGYEGIGCYAPLTCPPRTRPNEFAWDNINGDSRRVTSAFTELYIPVVAPESQVPLVRSLTLDAAERYDHYSDFGNTENPKLSLTWAMSRDVKLRGSWGTSFRAPSLVDINPFVFSFKGEISSFPNFTGNPAIAGFSPVPGLTLSNVGLVIGDQPNLKPETAHTWSAGFDLTPHWVPSLEVSTTYYHIQYSNEIFGPPVFPGTLLNPATYQLYSAYVHPVHNPADCTGSHPDYDPALQPFINAVGIYGIVTPAQLCDIQVWVDGRNTNIGSMTEGGVDMDVKYHFTSRLGHWMLGLNATKVVTQRLAAVSTAPETSILGLMGSGGLVPWRGRGSLGWGRGALSASLFVNYIGQYTNNNPLPGRTNSKIASWTTFDLNLGVDVGALADWRWLENTTASLSAQNLFDRNPPLVLTAGGGAFDANNANVFGRIVSLQFTVGL